jgi:hypothetical protein
LRAGFILIFHPAFTVFDHDRGLTVSLLDPFGTGVAAAHHTLTYHLRAYSYSRGSTDDTGDSTDSSDLVTAFVLLLTSRVLLLGRLMLIPFLGVPHPFSVTVVRFLTEQIIMTP